MELTLFRLKRSTGRYVWLCTSKDPIIQLGDYVKITATCYMDAEGVVDEIHKIDYPDMTQPIRIDAWVKSHGYNWKYIPPNGIIKDCTEKLRDLTLFSLRDSMSGMIKRFAIPYRVVKQEDHISISSDSLGYYAGKVEFTFRYYLAYPLSCEDLKNIQYLGENWMFVSNPKLTLIEESPSNKNTTNISKTNSMKTNKIFDTMMERFKAQFMPVVDESLQVTMDGEVAVPTKEGDFVAIKDEELTSYPAEMTLDMPVYVLAKKVEDVKAGDIIKSGSSYSKVTKVNKNNQGKLVSFSTLSYSGHGKTVKPITDFLMGQSTVKVVINLMSGFGDINGINPMMLMALKDGDSDNSLMMLLLMQQMNGGAQAGTNPFGNINPMMFMLMGGEGNNDTFKTILMMQMMQGNMNLFGAASADTPAAE